MGHATTNDNDDDNNDNDDNDDEGSLWAVPYEYMIVVFLSWCQCQELIIIMLVWLIVMSWIKIQKLKN